MQKTKLIPLILSLAALAGCDKEVALHSGLAESQANMVMAALLDGDVPAHKVAGAENTWDVMIMEGDFARAVNLLERRGLPRREYHGVSEAFKKTGMVSSPTEERIRFMDALSQDISRTIAQIDGVIDARVHVVLPENDPFAKNVLPSSAAVAIRSRWDCDLRDLVPSIKALVQNSIEGLKYDKITVTIFRDNPPNGR